MNGRMTLDEAIKIAKSDIKYNKSIGCDTLYEEQLAEWLEELKEYKYNEYVICEKYNVSSIDDVYNKAIDDLSEKLCCEFSENSTKGECEGFTCDILTLDSVSDLVISVSEQLRQKN